MTMTLLISEADFEEVIDKLIPLTQKHWDEIGHPGTDFKLKLDMRQYTAYNREGLYRVFTVFDTDKDQYVGYLGCLIHPLPHSENIIAAITDAIFLLPEYRKGTLGIRLVKYAEKALKDLGVHVLELGTNARYDLSSFCKRLGYTASSITYTKQLR